MALCHGCFDILHAGHLRHFEAARRLADFVVVTVTPDEFVNKGPNRPVFSAAERAELLAGLRDVEAVAINRWPSAVETIRLVRPDVFVKGDEYEAVADGANPLFREERRAAEEVGVRIAFTHEDRWSSSAAYQRLSRG